jgi:hypothetical protein
LTPRIAEVSFDDSNYIYKKEVKTPQIDNWEAGHIEVTLSEGTMSPTSILKKRAKNAHFGEYIV